MSVRIEQLPWTPNSRLRVSCASWSVYRLQGRLATFVSHLYDFGYLHRLFGVGDDPKKPLLPLRRSGYGLKHRSSR